MAKRAAEKQERQLNLEVLNQSELAKVAREVATDAHRDMPRDVLYAIINDGDVTSAPPRLLNKTRLKIMQYLNDNFEQLECLLSCPAKSRDPYACFQCSDLQVASCTLENDKMFTENPESQEQEIEMPNTVKVESPSGNVELQVFTEEEIDTLLADNNPASRSQIMEHMKALGRPIGELIKMKPPERKAFILERYAELGIAAGASKKAAPKGGTVTQLKPAQAARTTAPAKAVKAAPAKVKEEEPEDETEEAAGGDASSGALGAVISAQNEAIGELKQLVATQGEKIDQLVALLDDVSKLVFDTHFITRAALPVAAALSEDDIITIGNENGVYGKLLAGEAEVEGND